MIFSWIAIAPETLAQAVVEFEKACKELKYKIQTEPIAVWQSPLFDDWADDAIVYARVTQ